jgi:hypothetical protein
MIPPELSKRTEAAVELIPQLDKDGSTKVIVIIKLRFSVRASGRVTSVPGARIRRVEEPWDEDHPESSSAKWPSDVCLRKPSTDVILVGNAVAPLRRRATELDVLVHVGPLKRQLRVFGLRVWYRALGGLSLTPPQPFEEVALRWENAFGGSDLSNPKKPAVEPRNPFGRGVACDPAKLIHQPGPQVEDPADLIHSQRSRPAPAGVAPIAPHVLPRSRFAGTCDDQWEKERMPLPPLDFDDRHNQVAPPELIAPQYLRGGEAVQLVNVCADGALQFELPKRTFAVASRGNGRSLEHRAVLDTVVFEPNVRAFELTWRAAVPVPKKARELSEIQVYEKAYIE